MTGIELILLCAPTVPPAIVQQIITVESAGNPIALNVNKGKLQRNARDVIDAAQLAHSYIQQGYSVDMGLMQVNSTNLKWLGYTVEDMFDPCKNLEAGARVFTNFHQNAQKKYPDDRAAILATLSAYNTGSFTRGFRNGYVGKFNISADMTASATFTFAEPPAPTVPPAQELVAVQPPTTTRSAVMDAFYRYSMETE